MTKSWIVFPIIICIILSIACGYLYREWQYEKFMRDFMETAYESCKENCDYWQQQNDYYYQLYNDCLNSDNPTYRWEK